MLIESLSGVRGMFGKDLTLDIAQRYAASYSSFLLKSKKGKIRIILGMDTRPSGPQVKDAMLPYLPVDIIDVGLLPTPMIEQAVRHFKADGGIIITASHNEPYDNGFKFLGSDGAILSEKDMEKVISLSRKMDAQALKRFFSKYGSILSGRKVNDARKEAIDAYRNFAFSIIGKRSLDRIRAAKLKIVVDPNGGTGIVAKHILERAGVSILSLNMVPGNFSHRIEPTQETLYYLSALIKKESASFGAGFDCDADRVEIVLESGRVVSGNELIGLASKHILLRSQNPTKEVIVVNNATSSMVKDIASSIGATVKEVEVGESNVIAGMQKFRSRIGGEGSSSGVILAPQTCRDGILGVLLVCAIIAESKKPLARLIEELPQYSYLKKKIEIDPQKMGAVMRKIISYYRKKKLTIKTAKNGSIKILMLGKTFAWFRQSKTEEGVIRVIVDSPDAKKAEAIMEEALQLVK